jgi:hypothetical protein
MRAVEHGLVESAIGETLPTFMPSTPLPLPAEVGLDDYQATMRPGDEDDALTEGFLD